MATYFDGTISSMPQAQLASGTNVAGTFTLNPGGTVAVTLPSVTIGTALPASNANIGTVTVGANVPQQISAGTNVVGTFVLNTGATIAVTLPQAVLAAGTNVFGALAAGTNVVGTVSVNPLPTSTNSIGTVTVANNPPIAAGTNVVGTVTLNTGGTVAITAPQIILGAGTNVAGTVSINSIPTGASVIGTATVQGTVTNIHGISVTMSTYTGTALSTTAGTVKSTAGTLVGGNITNPNSSIAYVQFFDTASSALAGTTAPSFFVGIPATGGNNVAMVLGQPVAFANGLKVLASTTPNGSTANGTALPIFLTYK